MAWIERRNRRYVVIWRDADGKHRTEPIDRRPDADARLREIEAEIAARKPARTSADLPVAEILERYRLRQLARGSREIHVEKQVHRIASLCVEREWSTCRKITPASVEEWRQAGGSPRAGAYLRAILRWAKETLDQRVDDRALVALRPRAARRRPRTPLATTAQLANWQARADEIGPDVGALLHCLATYGWRPITAADLTVGDLDLDSGLVTTRVKGGDIVRHPLLPATLGRLAKIVKKRAPSAPLFRCPTTGEAWNANASRPDSIPQWFRDMLGLRSYDLKRWAISSMLERKLEPQTVALFTGHRTISQVLTYARTNEERARQALAALAPPGGDQ